MKLRTLYIVIIALILFSCNKNANKIEVTYLYPEISKSCFNDSIFFSEIVSIENIDDEYFLVDVLNHIIINIDSAFNFIQTIGQQGRGPGEFLHPFNVFDINNQIFISDAANRRINVYSKTKDTNYKFIRAVDIDFFIRDNKSLLFLNDTSYCCSTPEEVEPIKMINFKNRNYSFFGKFYDVVPKHERNSRFLVMDDESIYSVGVSEPIIEKYNLYGELINRTSMYKTSFFKKTLKEHKKIYKKFPKNTTPFLFKDVSVINNNIYLLMTERFPNGFAQTNKILVLKFVEKQYIITKIFDLGKGRFSSFCISKNLKKILAFNEYLGDLQIYNYPN